VFQTIINAYDLAKNLDKSNWLILDCRAHFSSDKENYNEYTARHIPNAFYCSITVNKSLACKYDLNLHSDTDNKIPLDTIVENGFNQNSQIIIYDKDSSEFTDSMWLQFRALGFKNAAVLQGVFSA